MSTEPVINTQTYVAVFIFYYLQNSSIYIIFFILSHTPGLIHDCYAIFGRSWIQS